MKDPENESATSSRKEPRGEEGKYDRQKFNKVEMPTFEGDDPDDWLFQAVRYFDIHQLTDKITVTAVSFAGAALHWYRWAEGREPFTNWRNLKYRMLEKFRPSQEGSLCARFLAVKQEGNVAEFRKQFETLAAPLPHLAEEMLENTF